VSLHSGPGRQFELGVADDGVGFPDGLVIEHSSTLGLQIVTILAGQLGGTVALSRDGGTYIAISFAEME
jgi:two-component sensor histidine kinase